MSELKVKNETLRFDKERAEHFLTEYAYDQQRSKSNAHVNKLLEVMSNENGNGNGNFFSGVPTIILAEYNGRKYLVNGQHTLTAIMVVNKIFELSVRTITVNRKSDIDYIYIATDENRVRNMLQVVGATRIGDETGIEKKLIAVTATASKFLKNDFHMQSLNMNEPKLKIFRYMRKHFLKELIAYAEITKQCEQPKFQKMLRSRSGVVAVALATLKHAPDKATEFWSALVSDSPQTPISHLANYLKETFASGGSGDTTSAGRIRNSQWDFAYMTSFAWNCFVNNEEISYKDLLQIKNSPKGSIIISQTPYDGATTESVKENIKKLHRPGVVGKSLR